MNTQRFVPFRLRTDFPRFFISKPLIFCSNFRTPKTFQCFTKCSPCADRKHLIGKLIFLTVWCFKSGTKPFVPPIKTKVWIFPPKQISSIQLAACIGNVFFKQDFIIGEIIVVNQTLNPVKRVTGNSICIISCSNQIVFHKIVVSKSKQGDILGDMGIARP